MYEYRVAQNKILPNRKCANCVIDGNYIIKISGIMWESLKI